MTPRRENDGPTMPETRASNRPILHVHGAHRSRDVNANDPLTGDVPDSTDHSAKPARIPGVDDSTVAMSPSREVRA